VSRLFGAIGALSGFVAVAAGAFGAHALRARLAPDLLAVFETGARYQMVHALALLLVAVVHAHRPVPLVRAAGWLFTAGSVIFAGSRYALALSSIRALGAITPVGGVCFLAGWLCLATVFVRRS
jgi:uncharacterized membrane protein YgdD (TMEM256/DUF423 family)